ncbi:MAG: hypothetical protein AB7K24_01470 [Gemmataceae bacterium]
MSPRTVRASLVAVALMLVVLFSLSLLPYGGASEYKLKRQLAGVDLIRVRSGGTCHRMIEQERVLFEETDPARVGEIIEAIRIDNQGMTIYCSCCGTPSIEFYRGGQLVVTLGCHHGKFLRWREGWKSDGELTEASAAWLKGWLASHGIAFADSTSAQDLDGVGQRR